MRRHTNKIRKARRLHEASSRLRPYEVEYYVENLKTNDSAYIVLPASDKAIEDTYRAINNSNRQSEIYLQPIEGSLYYPDDIYMPIEKVNDILEDIADSVYSDDETILAALADVYEGDLDEIRNAVESKSMYFYDCAHNERDLGIAFVQEACPDNMEDDIQSYAGKKFGELIGNCTSVDYEQIGLTLLTGGDFYEVKNGYIEIA